MKRAILRGLTSLLLAVGPAAAGEGIVAAVKAGDFAGAGAIWEEDGSHVPSRDASGNTPPHAAAIAGSVALTANAEEESGRRSLLPRIPAEVFFQRESRTDFTISPDGRTIAFIGHAGSRQDVFVRNVANGATRQLTNDGAAFPAWSFENREPYSWLDTDTLLLARKDPQGQSLFVASLATGEVRRLTDSPGSTSVLVSTVSGRPREVMVSCNRRDPAAPDLYRLDVATGEMTLVYQNPGGRKAYFTDADGRLRVTRDQTGVFTFSTTDAPTRISDHGRIELFVPVRVTADGTTLYGYSAVGRERLALVAHNLDSGAEKVLWDDDVYDLYSREERNDAITPTAGFSYSTVLQRPLSAYFYRDDFRTRFFDEGLQARVESARRQIGDYDLRVGSFSDDLDRLIIQASSSRAKGAIYLYDHGTRRATLLHRLSDWLPEREMGDVRPIQYRARDGRTIRGYLTFPPGREPRNLPLVVYTHGGPFLRDTHGFSDISQFFANRGYLVLECDYRGSSGYGVEFQMAGYKQLGRAMQDDITDGVEWVVAQGLADRRRVAIYGFSSGGLNVLAGLAFTPDLYACGVSVAGLVHLEHTIQAMGPPVYPKFGDPVEDVEALRKASPYFFSEAIRAPVILAYGARDGSIPIQDVDELVAKLKGQGNDVDYLRYEDLGHNLLYEPAAKLEIFQKMERLFERCLSEAAAAPRLVVDGHNHDGLTVREGTVDSSGMKELARRGIGAVVVPLPLERTPTDDLSLRVAGEVEALRHAAAADGGFALATDQVPLPGQIGSGLMSVLLSIEWFRPIFGGDPDRVQVFRRLGVRMISLVESDPDGLFDPGAEAATLTDLGRRTVAAMNENEVIIDVTHLSHPQKLEVIAHSRAPVVASHSLVQGVTRQDFNLPDEVVDSLAAHGGSVWVSFNRSDLLGGADEDTALDLLIEHISYLVARLGPEHVGIGTDLQAGGRYVPPSLNKPDVFDRIRQRLAARGFSRATIDGILGGNVLRVLRGSSSPDEPAIPTDSSRSAVNPQSASGTAALAPPANR